MVTLRATVDELAARWDESRIAVVDDQSDPIEPLYAAMVAGGVPYNPWRGLPLGPDQCFVCGCTLDTANRTEEDVFPRWLQQDLRALPERSRRPLLLPNLTAVALNQVRIPAVLIATACT